MKAYHVHFTTRLGWLLMALWLFAAGSLGPVWAENPPTFTVLVDSAFLRSEPNVQAQRTYSIFKGQVFLISGRTANSAWVQLDFAGGRKGTWVWAPLGKVTGDLSQAPILAGTTAAPATIAPASAIEANEVGATTGVTFTVIVSSVFGRSEPSLSGFRVVSLFKGQKFTVLARTPDSTWVKVASSPEGWVFAEYGTFTRSVIDVAVEGAVPNSEASALHVSSTPAVLPPMPEISARAREIYQLGLKLGNNPRTFAKVGDCNSTTPYFLAAFDSPGSYRLGQSYASLQETVRQFAGSFSRQSQAAQVGFSTTSVLSSQWANPIVCRNGETPLTCEYRRTRPSLAIVSLGTNGEWLSDQDYETGLRHILDYSLQQGVLPILGTKSDDVEGGGGRYTPIVVKLAHEYSVPLWDFRLAASSLSDRGLMSDGYHLTWAPAYFDDPAQINTGWQVRNLTALQMLDAVWHAVR
jgi:hypothetical protein